ncbi:MAG: class I SAM-dependent methyltransferase [Pseudomonadota bacterium]
MTPWRRLLVPLARRWPKRQTLEQKLRAEARTQWLDIGGIDVARGFDCVGLADPETVPHEQRCRYVQCDVLRDETPIAARQGHYDLVRLQHVFEHFSFEDGRDLLAVVRRLLAPGGYLLMTVPDLRAFIAGYRWGFRFAPEQTMTFQRSRIPEDAPASFRFSMYAHQYGYSRLTHNGEQHAWCYDFEGLAYQVRAVGGFDRVQRLGLFHPLASIPFTHNRPAIEVCLLARKAAA